MFRSNLCRRLGLGHGDSALRFNQIPPALTIATASRLRGRFNGFMTVPVKRYLRFLVAFILAFLAVVEALDFIANRNREQVNQELQKLLGKDVGFDDLEVSVWGGLGFSAKEFHMADDSHFAATPLLHAKELKLGVSLLPLLMGRVVIKSLVFDNPELQIITDEAGRLNLSRLAVTKKDFDVLPRAKPAVPEKHPSPVSFLISKIQIHDGRIDFFDRSVNEPAEIQINNIDMEVIGLDPSAPTRVKLTAALTEGLKRDVTVSGQLGPIQPKRRWPQQPLDLEIRFDSLYVPMLARALPFLRNRIPRELDVTGPMSLSARLTGSLEQPRLTDLVLKVPFFGSSDYNAVLQGSVSLPATRAWDEAKIQGKLAIDPVNLASLRKLPFLSQLLPDTFVTEGPISVYSRFEGPWEKLRIGALIQAKKSGLRYSDWLHKPAGIPADLRARISRQEDTLVVRESVLRIGRAKMHVSGIIGPGQELHAQLKLPRQKGNLAALGRILSPLSFYGIRGNIGWDLQLNRSLSDWSLAGKLSIADAEFRHKETGRIIDDAAGSVVFSGKQARVQNASFRLGSSRITMTADIPNIGQPSGNYSFASPELNSTDLPGFPAGDRSKIKNVNSSGQVRLENGALLIQGAVFSPEGNLQDFSYRNLRADIGWSVTGMSFKNLSLEALKGRLRSDGYWIISGDRSHRWRIESQLDSMDVQTLLSETFPQLSGRVEGQLDFHGRLDAPGPDGQSPVTELKGSGAGRIQHGRIRNFNLLSQLFFRDNEPSAASRLAARLPARLMTLLKEPDTRFDTLKSDVSIEQQQIRMDNLLLSTPDYNITGSGWVDFDGTTKWSGVLVLSPKITQELQRDFKPIRYLLDRRGRLSLSFRIDGTLLNPKIRPENRALSQALGLGWRPSPKSGDSPGNQDQAQGARKRWLPESLDQLLPH